MAKPWNDPSYQSSIIPKGRRASTHKPIEVTTHLVDERMLCTNCGNPVSIKIVNRCRCGIWDVGKVAKRLPLPV